MVEFLKLNPQFQGIGFTSQRTRNRMVQRLVNQGISNPQVLDAFSYLPRHLFVDEALAHRAYEDTALPLGMGQTLSQPYIVALMTELALEVEPKKALEIGTGSGFQAAVLGCLVPEVWSVERIEFLLEKAKQRLRQLKLDNVRVHHADGGLGLEKEAPFDVILVTAAPPELPKSLFTQLNEGGRIIAPVGKHLQQLRVYDKHQGRIKYKDIAAVRFVPLIEGLEKSHQANKI